MEQKNLKILIIAVFIASVLGFVTISRDKMQRDGALGDECKAIRTAYDTALASYIADKGNPPVSITNLRGLIRPEAYHSCPAGGTFFIEKKGESFCIECSVHWN